MQKIFVPGIYKPPNLCETDFTTSHEKIISKLSNSYEKLILMGEMSIQLVLRIKTSFGKCVICMFFTVFAINMHVL